MRLYAKGWRGSNGAVRDRSETTPGWSRLVARRAHDRRSRVRIPATQSLDPWKSTPPMRSRPYVSGRVKDGSNAGSAKSSWSSGMRRCPSLARSKPWMPPRPTSRYRAPIPGRIGPRELKLLAGVGSAGDVVVREGHQAVALGMARPTARVGGQGRAEQEAPVLACRSNRGSRCLRSFVKKR